MRVVCGPRATAPTDGELDNVLTHLGKELDDIMNELGRLVGASDRELAIFAPLLARALMEVSFTAIIARLDPFRLLAIHRMQMSTNYEHSVPWRNAIRWQGDIVAPRPKDMWGAAVDPKDVSRALFGSYYDELVWQPAFKRLSDSAPLAVSSRWLGELLALPPESFCPRKRDSVAGLYSKLSKSVHFESVVPAVRIDDRVSIVESTQRVIREVAEIALLSHCVPHAYSSCTFEDAIDQFYELEAMEIVG